MSENQGGGAQAPQSNGMATASLILGIVSIVFVWLWFIGLICGILAIIFAIMAKKKIKQNPNMGGAGSAKGGMITGIIGVAIWIIFMILVAVVFTTVAGAVDQDAWNEAMKELDKLK